MSAFVKTVGLAQKLCAANPAVARQAIRSSKCHGGGAGIRRTCTTVYLLFT